MATNQERLIEGRVDVIVRMNNGEGHVVQQGGGKKMVYEEESEEIGGKSTENAREITENGQEMTEIGQEIIEQDVEQDVEEEESKVGNVQWSVMTSYLAAVKSPWLVGGTASTHFIVYYVFL